MEIAGPPHRGEAARSASIIGARLGQKQSPEKLWQVAGTANLILARQALVEVAPPASDNPARRIASDLERPAIEAPGYLAAPEFPRKALACVYGSMINISPQTDAGFPAGCGRKNLQPLRSNSH
jgi:hypothetical protein